MSNSRLTRSLLLFLFLALLSTAPRTGQAQGAGGRIGIFSDTFGANCGLSDTAVPNYWHIVHTIAPGAWGSRFSAPLPTCYPGLYLTDNKPFPVTIGSSQTGVTVRYDQCILNSPIHVLTIVVFGGGTPPCCFYRVLPNPIAASGRIELVDCEARVLFVNGGEGIIHPNTTCQCDVPTGIPDDPHTTWGRVKALYQ